jgi:hypothetical protein
MFASPLCCSPTPSRQSDRRSGYFTAEMRSRDKGQLLALSACHVSIVVVEVTEERVALVPAANLVFG